MGYGETGYIDAIVGGVASIVDTITEAATGQKGKIAEAEAAAAKAKLAALQFHAAQQATWVPGVPNWAVAGAVGGGLIWYLTRGRR